MSTPQDPAARKLLIVFARLAAFSMLIAAIALLVWVTQKGETNPRPNAESVAVTDASVVKATNPQPNAESAAITNASVMKPAVGGKRFTLRLGQGFRFKDSAVVVAKPDEQP